MSKVRSGIASTYAQKRITGDFDKDSQRHVSIFTWNDQRGGAGRDRMSLDEGNRSFTTQLDITHKGHLIAHGIETAAVDSTETGPMLISQLGTTLVVGVGDTILEFVSVASWTNRHTNTGNAEVAGVANGSLAGTEFLAFCYTSGYTYSSAVATWADSAKNAVNIVFHNERFWGIDAVGQLWYTFTMGSAEVNDALLPLGGGDSVTYLFEARDHGGAFILYAMTTRGLWQHDEGNRKFVQVTGIFLPGVTISENEIPAAVYRERIYLAAGRAIIEYDPIAASVRQVGFDLDDGLPAGKDGQIKCMTATPNLLFAGTSPVSSSDDAILMGWSGLGWSEFRTRPDGDIETLHFNGISLKGTGGDFPAVVTTSGSDLMYGFESNTAEDLVGNIVINTSETLPANINAWLTRSSGKHTYPVFTAGQSDVSKVLLRLKVEVAGAAGSGAIRAVVVFIAFDGGSETQMDQTFTNDSTFDATDDRIEGSGITTFHFPSVASPAGTEFLSLQVSVEVFHSGSNAVAPVDTLSVTIEYLKVLDEKLGFTFELDFSQEHDAKSPEQLRASFAITRALKTLFELTYRDDTGNTRNYYVKMLAPTQGEEESGHEERGTVLVSCEEI